MKNTKKILAVVLSVMLLLSVMPFAAFAATGVANGAELKAAIAAAQDGDVIEFTADVTEYPATSGALVIPVDGKDITIDLKGHTQYFRVSGEITITYPTDLFVLMNGAKLTVIDSEGGGAIYATYGANSSAYIFNVLDSSELVINGGTFVMDKANRGGVIVYQNSADASTTINGGTFQTVPDPTATRSYRNYIVNDTRGEVEINGGTFTTGQNFDYVISEGNTTDTKLTINDGEFNGTMSLDVSKADTTLNGGTYLTREGEPNTAVSAYLPVDQIIDSTTGEIKNVDASTVARTNSDEFATIDAAFAAIASSTGTIELNILENVTATSVLTLNNAQVLKIHLNGKTITADGNGKTAANVPHIKVYPGTQLSIYGPGSIVTANTPNPYDGALIKVYGAADDSGAASKTYIYDGAVISSSGYGISLFPAAGTKAAYNASISISNGTVENTSTHDAAAIAVSGNIQTGDSVITVSKATITGNSTKGVGVFVGGKATVNFTSSSVATVSGATGIYQKGGTVNFGNSASNVSVIGNGASADYKYYGNGFVATGDAYVIDNCGYPAGAPVSTINNSKFTSTNGEAVASYVKQDDATQTGDFERVDEIIPATSTAVFSSDVTALAVDGYETVYDEEAGGYVVEKDTHSVAELNGVKYDTLQAALSAVYGTGTVKLLQDVTVSERLNVFDNTTLDLNGYNITSTYAGNGGLTICNANLTVTGEGTISANSLSNSANVFVSLYTVGDASASLTVQDDAIIESNGYTVSLMYGSDTYSKNVTINVEGGAVKSSANPPISINGQVTNHTNTINISGGTVETTNTNAAAIFASGYANWNISGGTVKGGTGIYAKSGNINISDDANIVATGAQSDYQYVGNGAHSTGDAIVIDNCGYPGGEPSVNISGGTITSANNAAVASYVKQDDATQTGDFERVDDVIPAESTAVFSSDVTALAAPGYKTVYDEEAGGYVVEQVNANNGSSLTLDDAIALNAYLDIDAYGVDASKAYVKLNYNQNADISKTKDFEDIIIPVSEATKYIKDGDPFSGTYKFSFKMAPAQYAEDVSIELYADDDAATPAFSVTRSIKTKCEQFIANGGALGALCEAVADYCQAAQFYFDYDAPATASYYNDGVTSLEAGEMEVPTASVGISATNYSFTIVSGLEANVFFSGSLKVTGVSIDSTKGTGLVKAAVTAKQGNACINIKGIASGNLDNLVTVTTNTGSISLAATNIAKAIVASSNNIDFVNLARALYLYSVQASAYFNC
ncbi:MAG: hypothetical protein IJJ41_02460 [Clostridia bacterium]|nr:hypothetical protein [Clostridia bacterium]